MTESSQDEFNAKCFIIFTIDEEGNPACELHWGQNKEDIILFAQMLQSITTGEFNDAIMQLMEQRSKQNRKNKAALNSIKTIFTSETNKEDDDLVIDPLKVEIFK